MHDAAGYVDLSAAAIHHPVGRRHMLIKRRRVSHQLEGRSRLIYVADRVVAQQVVRGVAKIIGIEGRSNGQRQYLSGMRVLHHDGAGLARGSVPCFDPAPAPP